MERRAFLAAVSMTLLAAPDPAGGQRPGRVYRVGIIHQGGLNAVVVDGLRAGLSDLGLDEGTQIVLDIRDTHGSLAAVEEAARDLERGSVDLIYTAATSVTIAAKRATAKTPIVFYAGNDPIAAGLVQSLAKPGGRLTGVHGLSGELTAKRLQVLKEMLPGLARVVSFYSPGNAVARNAARLGRESARQLGVEFVDRHVGSAEELRRVLQTLQLQDGEAVFYLSDAMVTSQAELIIEAARAKKWPTMFHETSLVVKGALASYGPSFREIGRMSAKHVQRVLTGTHPKDLPVENYHKVEFALNLRTAREIGLAIPPAVLARVDKIIE